MQLIVGRIIRPHGIRGELLVEVRTDEPEARFAVGSVFATEVVPVRGNGAGPAASADPSPDGSGERLAVPDRLTLESFRWHQGRLIAVFEGCYDRNVAEMLRGVRLCVDSAEVAPPEDPDEFHDHQLVGLAVVSVDGEAVGEITRVDHAHASDLLVVRRPEGRTALIPFVRAIVPQVDLAGGRVIVDPPSGLLDL